MRSNVRLLAVSRMEAGFCVAGIPEGSSRWVRPVKRFGHIEGRELLDASGRVVEPLDLVEYELFRAKPERPHVEDWSANFLRRPVIKHRPSDEERGALLERLVETSADAVLRDKIQSLVLIKPDAITWASFVPESSRGNYQVRIAFSAGGVLYERESARPGFPCTDFRLRNWGRRFGSAKTFNDSQLKRELGVDRIFLVLGLTRLFEGRYWPMVVGFHTCPDFPGEIDLSNP